MRGISWSWVAVVAATFPSQAGPRVDTIVIPGALRDAMAVIWKENNRHWDELADVNTLAQLIGTGRPTQREYLGCLTGRVDRDTVWVDGLAPAANLRQLQLAGPGPVTASRISSARGTPIPTAPIPPATRSRNEGCRRSI
jgi:hypothetical protein